MQEAKFTQPYRRHINQNNRHCFPHSIKMLATTTSANGIPDKAWQPAFVVLETT